MTGANLVVEVVAERDDLGLGHRDSRRRPALAAVDPAGRAGVRCGELCRAVAASRRQGDSEGRAGAAFFLLLLRFLTFFNGRDGGSSRACSSGQRWLSIVARNGDLSGRQRSNGRATYV